MSQSNHPLARRSMAPPLIVTIAILAAAPFMREIREVFFGTFASRALPILAGGMVALLAVLLIVALARIRTHRGWRYAGLLLVLVLLWLQIKGFSQGNLAEAIRAEVNMVERFHIVEYGLLAILLYRALYPAGVLWCLLAPLAWITVAGTLDEGVQWLSPRRTGEIRDVAMNVVAGATGLLFASCLWSPIARPPAIPALNRATLLRMMAVVALVLGVFVDTAHLGFAIDDPTIGRFRSWYSPRALETTRADRARAWDVPNPPTGQEVWALQDPYMEEASRHTQHRQESLRDGRLVMAWHANAILERYYGPYLDKRLPKGGNHRLPAHARDRLEREGAPRAHPAGYESPVLRTRIWIWPGQRWFRVTLAALVVGLWVAAWRAQPPDMPAPR